MMRLAAGHTVAIDGSKPKSQQQQQPLKVSTLFLAKAKLVCEINQNKCQLIQFSLKIIDLFANFLLLSIIDTRKMIFQYFLQFYTLWHICDIS